MTTNPKPICADPTTCRWHGEEKPAEQRWNSRYVEYARLTGATSPEAAQARDDESFRGGRNTGFILFIARCWREWRAANGRQPGSILSQADHDAFDAWLAAKAVQS